MAANVIWKPQPAQVRFLRRPEYEALYGGAAGGGKSEALVMEAVRQVHIPHYRALLLRKTYPELSELVGKSLNYYPRVFPQAKFNETKHRWTFPSGATVEFGAMHRTADKLKYQGRTWDFIAFDELTHFTWEEYSYLFSRNRPNGPGTRVYMRATANPGGIGHGWVKERFISAAPPGTRIVAEMKVEQPDGTLLKMTRDRVFIPAKVYDNQILLNNDPNYVANLSMLPEAERRALLEGDWDSFSGQVFTEWKDDPAHYHDRRFTHVIAPFDIPPEWPVYRGFDWGYSRPFSVGWWAVDHDGCMYRVRELYGCTAEPNTGVKWTPEQLARKIREIEGDDPNLKGRRIHGIADPAIWDGSGGESIADVMERAGVYFDKADHARISGKMQIHNRLAFDENGKAMLYVFSGCRQFIRTIPALVYSQTDVEDVDTDCEDHIYDEMRYIAMERKMKPRAAAKPKEKQFDPLEDNRYEEFTVFR